MGQNCILYLNFVISKKHQVFFLSVFGGKPRDINQCSNQYHIWMTPVFFLAYSIEKLRERCVSPKMEWIDLNIEKFYSAGGSLFNGNMKHISLNEAALFPHQKQQKKKVCLLFKCSVRLKHAFRIWNGDKKRWWFEYHEHILIMVMTFAGNDIDKRDKRTQKHRSPKIRDDNENW